MKKNLKLMTFVLVLVLLCVGTLPLTLAEGKRSGLPTASHINLTSSLGSAAVVLQGTKTYRQDVAKVLKRHDSVELEPQRVAEQVRLTGRLSLPTAEGTFELNLAPHDMRAANYRAQATFEGGEVRLLERGSVRTYKGTVDGMEGAQARFTIDENTLEGLIITSSDLYFVEPAKRYSASASTKDFIVYRASDLIQTTFGECGVTLAEKVGSEAAWVESQVPKMLGPGAEELFSPPRVVDLATEADFEYFQANASSVVDANNEIMSIMNQVEGIYDTQFGLQFSIVDQNVWATASDPYTSTVASTALGEFQDFWNANRGSVSRDLAHMWTGKSFDGSTIGIAFRPGLDCPLGFGGYGMSERLTFTPGKFIITAHEIGHNFNATHTDNPVQPGCTDTIMESSLGSMTMQTFCPFSVNEIETHASSKATCLPQGITPGCNYSLSPASQSLPVGVGTGNVNVTTVGSNCVWGATSIVSWITIDSGTSGINNGTVNFTVASNTGGFARSGVLRIAEQNATVNQAGGSGCTISSISTGQTIDATLSNSDCRSSQRPAAFADQYSFSGSAGQQIRIEMNATTPPQQGGLDTYLYLLGPNGNVVAENDDIVFGSETNSRIPQDGTLFTLPQTGSYIIESTSFEDNVTGGYTLTLTGQAVANSVSFSGAPFSVSEGADGNGIGFEGTGFSTITVQRSGDVSGAASIDYGTSNGSAESRKDYAQSFGTLRFAANETTKTFVVFITDDVFQEPQETVNLLLLNPVATTLGSTPTAVLTITSNDASTGANPVDPNSFNTGFFARQHYIDFFTREPDLLGLNFWKNQIDECTSEPCREVRRINVSGAFYLSIEFQQTGYLVYRTFATAFGPTRIGGTVPLTLMEFVPDVQRIGQGVIIGQSGAEALLEANKQAYFNEFVVRSQFVTQYPLSQTSAQFVDALNANALALSQAERDALVADLGSGAKTRAQVLRAVAEDSDLVNAHSNRAFVLMQYFGYLRRNPNDPPEATLDFQGYNFWLNKLNEFGGNFVGAEMVKSFIISSEYKLRFGP